MRKINKELCPLKFPKAMNGTMSRTNIAITRTYTLH